MVSSLHPLQAAHNAFTKMIDPLTLALVLAARSKPRDAHQQAQRREHVLSTEARMLTHEADKQAKREAREQLRKMKRRPKRQRKGNTP